MERQFNNADELAEALARQMQALASDEDYPGSSTLKELFQPAAELDLDDETANPLFKRAAEIELERDLQELTEDEYRNRYRYDLGGIMRTIGQTKLYNRVICNGPYCNEFNQVLACASKEDLFAAALDFFTLGCLIERDIQRQKREDN